MEDKNISMNEENNEVLLTGETAEATETNNEPIETVTNDTEAAKTEDNNAEVPLDKNVKLMSPMQMVIRRFFRSKLSIVGLVMIVSLFLFSFVGPLVYTRWGEIELDESGTKSYTTSEYPLLDSNGNPVLDENGNPIMVQQTVERQEKDNYLAPPSKDHLLGTDEQGYDVFTRLMYGGRISLSVSFIAVFVITVLGVILGGVSGYFGGVIDNLIMRICDVLMCLPGIPILLIISTLLEAAEVDAKYRIYWLMVYLTLFSWPGTARLVRGQILSLREQEYMVAAEAMGYSTSRKIFKHLVPNVMPQLIVQMTLSLGSMILYEATLSYLNMGVKAPYAAWGTMINIISTNTDILQNNFNVWGAPGICIVIAVLGFNFVGDGLRDALDPKSRR